MTSADARRDRVSVVVITHNRCDELAVTLQALKASANGVRVIVVDNASTDDTRSMLHTRFPGVETIAMSYNSGAIGRNVAVDHLRTPYVAFSDDDTTWQPGALERGVDTLDRHPQLATVTGLCLVAPDMREDPITPEMRHSPVVRPEWMPGPALLGIMAGLTMFRVSAYREVGGFCPRYWLGGEEELLALDLAASGWSMMWDERMVIHHRPSINRDPTRRRELGIRNTLWTLWLRRPALHAARRSIRILASAPHDRSTARALGQAIGAVGWVWRHRRVVPAHIERQLRQLEHIQDHSAARRYVG